jgi:predicted transposase/invertase (TIGR01784 family)
LLSSERLFVELLQSFVDRGTMITNLEKAFDEFEWKAEQAGLVKGKLEVAKTMLDKGMDVAFVMEMTGLPKEQIEKFKNR